MSSMTLDKILQTVTAYKASDLHLIAGTEPQIRISGKLAPLDLEVLDSASLQSLCYSVINDNQKKYFEENKELDFTFALKGVGRFRANYYFQQGSVAAAFRIIPEKIPTLEDLNGPSIFGELVKREKGLILVTGPTGSGKSTTMAAMINEININERKHIITIEDPVEFHHEHKSSVISQRNVGEDTKSFSSALKYAMREDPDVILVGEMRDVETIRAAVTAAETGHLVFATVHTNSATQTINRIINVFPSEEQAIIRTQLSMSLSAIISQTLVPKIDGGRVAAHEILINNPAIANLIREDKVHQIYSQLQLGQSKTGMQTLSQVLIDLVRARIVAKDDALRFATNKEEVERALGTGGGGTLGGL
ncbi:MAG: type IV pilus twitching motility protein PilT [Campylobacterales bacterium]